MVATLAEQFKAFAGKVPAVRADEVALYDRHLELLRYWNEQFNLVSRNAFEKAFANHYVDGIFVADIAASLADGRPLIDVGSGAGFPGLIFAIRYPQLSITLFEKSLKKQGFLSNAVVQLGLKNVQVSGLFGEEPLYGMVVARAVFPPDKYFKFMAANLKPKSRIVFQRGGNSEKPPVLPYFKALRSERYDLPLDCGSRFAEVFELVPRGTK
jgi:16S rRNA (guanine527-N7)-methyltransferase